MKPKFAKTQTLRSGLRPKRRRSCKNSMSSTEKKICQNCKIQFVIEPADFDFYKKIDVPTPAFCPDCRYQRRIANRNEWNFYKRTCSLCGVSMVSLYNSFYPGPVYCQPCYWSD